MCQKGPLRYNSHQRSLIAIFYISGLSKGTNTTLQATALTSSNLTKVSTTRQYIPFPPTSHLPYILHPTSIISTFAYSDNNLLRWLEESNKGSAPKLIPIKANPDTDQRSSGQEKEDNDSSLDSNALDISLSNTSPGVPVKRLISLFDSHLLSLHIDNSLLVLLKSSNRQASKNSTEWHGDESRPNKHSQRSEEELKRAEVDGLLIIVFLVLVSRLANSGWHAWHDDAADEHCHGLSDGNESSHWRELDERLLALSHAWETAKPGLLGWGGGDDVDPSHVWDGQKGGGDDMADEWTGEGESSLDGAEEDAIHVEDGKTAESSKTATDGAEMADGGEEVVGDWFLGQDGGLEVPIHEWCLGGVLGVLGIDEVNVLFTDGGLDEDGGWDLNHGKVWKKAGICVGDLYR